jgi:hypothetical protein
MRKSLGRIHAQSRMTEIIKPIPDRRPLSGPERSLAEWMLRHGEARAAAFLGQLERARVTQRCGCGCPSVDFEVEGLAAPTGPLRVLGDFVLGEPPDAGVMIFEQSGVLGGIEVYLLGGDMPKRLPTPEELRPYVPARDGEADADAHSA